MNEKKSYLLVIGGEEHRINEFGNGRILFNDQWHRVIPQHCDECDEDDGFFVGGVGWPHPDTNDLPEPKIDAIIAKELITDMNMIWCAMMAGEYCVKHPDPNIEIIIKVIPVCLVPES